MEKYKSKDFYYIISCISSAGTCAWENKKNPLGQPAPFARKSVSGAYGKREVGFHVL